MRFVVAIPARYESSRLPGKPLVMLNGIPMILRTYRQCLKAVDASKIYIVTDDDRIEDVCAREGAKVIMTSRSCLTGTDRVGEFSDQVVADTYINVQGDEPLFDPDDLMRLVEAAKSNPEEIINGYCDIEDEHSFRNPNIPKVVMRADGRLLYISRAGIPTSKLLSFGGALRQVCAYAFPKKALKDFCQHESKSTLETVEDIELLRFLELGWEVKMLRMSNNSIPVDTPNDVRRAEEVIARLESE